VVVQTYGEAVPETVRDQVERILSLDTDGSGFPEVGRRDLVVGRLQGEVADGLPGPPPLGLGLRQRPGGELPRHLKDGVSLPQHLAHQRGGQDRDLRAHRRLLQHEKEAHSALGYLSPAEFEEVRLVGEDFA